MGSNPNLERIKKELAKKRKLLLLAAKIAVGSSAAIYIAQLLGLEYAISAGTITLLTLMTTKWETVKLSVFRLVTFVVTILLAWAAFSHIKSTWIGYGVFIFCVVLFAELMGWRATISVNSVVGAHLLTRQDWGMPFVENELLLVLIGVVIAFLLNLFQNNDRNEKDIIENMRYTEKQLQEILCRFGDYLSQGEVQKTAEAETAQAVKTAETGAEEAETAQAAKTAETGIGQAAEAAEAGIGQTARAAEAGTGRTARAAEAGTGRTARAAEAGTGQTTEAEEAETMQVQPGQGGSENSMQPEKQPRRGSSSGNLWDDIIRLEKELQDFILEAYEYQENTFHSHPAYYIDYFEMRLDQCHVLHNLHYEVKKIRYIPKQAKVVAGYMLYLADYVVERNVPSAQMEKLEGIFRDMKKEELPRSREEFENRAILYHILMDMEEFLIYKQRFVKSLDERQKKLYWKETS